MRSGNQGASPTTVSTDGSSATCARDGAAHREADEERPLRADGVERGACVFDAPVEPLPRLDAVAHLGERELGEARRQVRNEPLERCAPCAFDLAALAAVDADDGRRRAGGPCEP